MTASFTAVAAALTGAADAMDANPTLTPDQALRLAIWGNAETPHPGKDEPGADTYDSASALIEAYCGYQGHGIRVIPQHDAIQAARTEAARYHTYGGGS